MKSKQEQLRFHKRKKLFRHKKRMNKSEKKSYKKYRGQGR